MDRYICGNCSKTFNNIDSDTGSVLVSMWKLYCPYCNSYIFYLTEHGTRIVERQKKLQKIDKNLGS